METPNQSDIILVSDQWSLGKWILFVETKFFEQQKVIFRFQHSLILLNKDYGFDKPDPCSNWKVNFSIGQTGIQHKM